MSCDHPIHVSPAIPRARSAPLALRLWLVLVCAAPGVASGQVTPAVPAQPAAPATPASALAVVERYMAAWNAHDAAKAASYMTDDVEYYDASTPAPQKGRDNARKNVIQAFLTAAPDCVWTRTGAPVIGKDGIAFQWTFKGTNTGPWSDGTKATGKPFSFNGLTLIRLRGGKIAYQGDYYDAYGFFKQLGLAQ
jgi:steroid delta-isomerase-like uncharacterized protein